MPVLSLFYGIIVRIGTRMGDSLRHEARGRRIIGRNLSK